MTTGPRPPVQPGERAPAFVLPAINRDGTVSLADYRGKSPLFLAVFRGLWCPFCRRAITELGSTSEKLRAIGVETLAVVASNVENSRLYFKLRPSRIALAADPECSTHRAYGIPKLAITPETEAALGATRINPTGELTTALPVLEAAAALDERGGRHRRTRGHRKVPERRRIAGGGAIGRLTRSAISSRRRPMRRLPA